MAKGTSRHWCFTSFEKECPRFAAGAMGYLVVGSEVCPDTEREHWQGYVQLKEKRGMKKTQEWLGDDRAHMEIMRGTPEQARDYCMKEGLFFEFGEFSTGQGSRTDIAATAKLVREGRWKEVDDSVFIIRNRGIAALHEKVVRESQTVEEKQVTVFWGPDGGAQEEMCWAEAGEEAYQKDNGPWWEGYKGEQDIVLAGFEPTEWDAWKFLLVTGKRPWQAPYKGGFFPLVAKRIWIYTDVNPVLWWPKHGRALKNRLSSVVKCGLTPTAPPPSARLSSQAGSGRSEDRPVLGIGLPSCFGEGDHLSSYPYEKMGLDDFLAEGKTVRFSLPTAIPRAEGQAEDQWKLVPAAWQEDRMGEL